MPRAASIRCDPAASSSGGPHGSRANAERAEETGPTARTSTGLPSTDSSGRQLPSTSTASRARGIPVPVSSLMAIGRIWAGSGSPGTGVRARTSSARTASRRAVAGGSGSATSTGPDPAGTATVPTTSPSASKVREPGTE